ncbi:MAG: endolytic transglycosylase MltG [Candidatus Eisenbacteria bacterium]|nr:endolytic transglycosylase MltG [Candidatus Eisenbacteria bacterium]
MTTALKNLLWILTLFLFLGFGVGSLFLPATLSPRDPTVTLTLAPGMTTRQIGKALRRVGVVRSSDAFMVMALVRGQSGRLRAGTYQISASEGLDRIVARLADGDVLRMAVTIPEGFNSREIAERVAPILGCGVDEFLAVIRDTVLARSMGAGPAGLEGYLFPDTYNLIPGTGASGFVQRLVERTITIFEERYAARAESLGLARHDALTLASLIEAEAAVDEERPRIAAVFWNRLREGMKLQSDPTVAYVLGRRPDRIYYKDLTVESPYNTYLVAGLPPGPICSPGEASIRAALYPVPNSRELYFVATGDGRHRFSVTNEQHNAARRQVDSNRLPTNR